MNILSYLEQTLPQNSQAIEIGVFKGGFSRKFLRRCNPARLILIDPWVSVDDPAHRSAWYHSERGNDMEAIYNDIRTQLRPEIDAGRVEIYRSTSAEVLPNQPDGAFDFIFVDGDHLYEPALLDLKVSFQKLKRGGIMLIDDYKMDAKFWWGDGVVRAVHDFLAQHSSNILLEKVTDGQIVVKKIGS
ncbi:class I SAM-dependent methyltransferase [Pseudosulfitobacter sp. SM2401]|uniref:class I SAM-dependent methyltransferase n=1 Tax=Pseudosulfitobacter sp. SM2401 TaxID=3350098 RepID=UPI0036F39DBF